MSIRNNELYYEWHDELVAYNDKFSIIRNEANIIYEEQGKQSIALHRINRQRSEENLNRKKIEKINNLIYTLNLVKEKRIQEENINVNSLNNILNYRRNLFEQENEIFLAKTTKKYKLKEKSSFNSFEFKITNSKYEEIIKKALKFNEISIDDYLEYIKQEDDFNIIKKALRARGYLLNYEELKDISLKLIINYFETNTSKIYKHSLKHQRFRFDKKFNIDKLIFFVELDNMPDKLTNDCYTKNNKNNNNKIKNEIFNSQKILIPCNIYYYSKVLNYIIDYIIKKYHHSRIYGTKFICDNVPYNYVPYDYI